MIGGERQKVIGRPAGDDCDVRYWGRVRKNAGPVCVTVPAVKVQSLATPWALPEARIDEPLAGATPSTALMAAA